MMRTFFLYVSLCFLPVLSFAQRGRLAHAPAIGELFLKDGCMSINAGIAQPFGSFASTDYVSDYDFTGYAQTGYTLNATFSYTILPPVGLAVQYTSTTNSINKALREKHLNAQVAPSRLTFETDDVRLYGFMAGLYYTIRAARFNTDFRVMAGYLNSENPDNFFYVNPAKAPGAVTDTFFIAARSSNDWAFSFGVGGRYQLYKDILLTMNAEILISDQIYRERYIYWQNISGILTLDNLKQPYRLANFTIGIGYQFE